MAKGEARQKQQVREKGADADQLPDSRSPAMGRPAGGGSGSQPGAGVLSRVSVGRLEPTRVNFTAPALGGKKQKKNEEASWLPTVMTLGGVLQHAVTMLASGEDRRSGPRRFLAPNPFRRWRLTGGFIPSRGPGWTPGNCYQSADTASRGPGVVTRLAAGPITDPGICLLAAVSGVGTGETTATGPAMFSHDLGRVCLARLALFQDDRVEDPQP